jgi:hypothetical protein
LRGKGQGGGRKEENIVAQRFAEEKDQAETEIAAAGLG